MKYGYRTSKSWRGFYAYAITYTRHTYGSHTSHGKRTVWKELSSRDLGEYPTRAEAQAAGKAWVEGKQKEKLMVANQSNLS